MNKDTVVAGIKFGLSVLIGGGVSIIVNSFVGNNVKTDDLSSVKKLAVGVASGIVGGMISDRADKYVSEGIDEVSNAVSDIRAELTRQKAANEQAKGV